MIGKFFCAALFAAVALQGECRTLRVLSYNICNARGMDGAVNCARTAAAISNAAPDFALLQELDVRTARSKGRDLPADLAARTGMRSAFGKAIDFQGGGYGVAILSREAPLATGTLPLPGREERRVLLWAEFKDAVICCTHLSLTADDSLASVGTLDSALKLPSFGAKPVLLAGDFNAQPDSPTVAAMKAHWRLLGPSGATFPADAPDRQIDYFFGARLPASWRVVKAEVLPEPAVSDHRPILLQISTGE